MLEHDSDVPLPSPRTADTATDSNRSEGQELAVMPHTGYCWSPASADSSTIKSTIYIEISSRGGHKEAGRSAEERLALISREGVGKKLRGQ